jgi:hypothetical protein
LRGGGGPKTRQEMYILYLNSSEADEEEDETVDKECDRQLIHSILYVNRKLKINIK